MSGSAQVRRVGDEFRITIQTGRSDAPLADVADCRLRYSGGLTYLPELNAKGQQSPQRTALGYFYSVSTGRAPASFSEDGAADAALAPLDVKKRYRQVLMQCDAAEGDNNDRLRFLLLAGDTLVEFAADGDSGVPLSVRHYVRVPAADTSASP